MDDVTVVVTGASRGLGLAVAETFAEAGATVVGCARDGDEIETALAGVDGAHGVVADVRDEFEVERLTEEAARIGGAIDIVVANAGVSHGSPGEMAMGEESYTAFDNTIRTNVRGTFATIREALPHLSDDARILVPSGDVARKPTEGMGAYAVSKAGAEAIVRGFAADTDHPVGVVDPGYVATDLTEGTGRDPEDVAGMFLWAAAEVDADRLDGEVLELKTWLKESRR